jgi:hypothetical protein
MAKIFNDFHFQIFVQMFVFKTTLPLRKIGVKFSCAKKMLGLGAISFDKAFSINYYGPLFLQKHEGLITTTPTSHPVQPGETMQLCAI